MDHAATSLDALWSPITIGPMRVANRVLTTGHALLYGEGGLISDRHIAYYEERARGGVGLLVTEQQAAHPSGRNYHAGCVAYDERAVPRYAKLADAVHRHGARMMAQLFCGGAQGSGTMYIDQWRPLLAPSTIASTQFHELPAAMEQSDIDDVVASFARSARNVRDGGLDGIEIHAAHSQLLGAFLSPAWNRRTNSYADGMRIVLEIGEAVRKEVGDALAVGLRLSVSEYLAGGAGIDLDATERQIARFAASGLFDFYDLSAGGYYAKHVSVTPMLSDLPDGFLGPAAKRLRAVAGNRGKVMVVGRVRTLEHAARLITEGAADMVAMTRAHIADPHTVRKTREGRAAQVVPCVGANVCVRRLGENNHVACLMNPVTGREAAWRMVHPAPVTRRVLVVGGGPCGMKAAALAAERGHRVWLVEAAEALGGHLRRMAALPGRGRWQDAIDSLAEPLARLGVETMLGVQVTPEMVRRLQPDVVACATGASFSRSGYSPARPDRAGIPGADSADVLDIGTALDRVLAGGTLGERVLILDEGQDVLTAGLAEMLGRDGAAVRIVTPHLYFGEALSRTYELQAVMKRLAALGVEVTAQTVIESIDGPQVRLLTSWSGAVETVAASTVVLAQARVPELDAFEALRSMHPDVRRIGDALAPRATEAVIYEGEAFGREL